MPDERPTPDGGSGDVPAVTPRALHERLANEEAVAVLDLRDRDEVEAWPIEGATVEHVPLARAVAAQAGGDLAALVADLPEPVVVVCPEGEASAEIAAALRAAGVEAENLAGGMEGWARLLVATELDPPAEGPDTAARVVQYERPATGCLSYLVHDGDVGAVVDPLRAFADRYARDADERGVELVLAVDTHVHADHLSGVRHVAERTGADVVAPEGATKRGLAFDARTVVDGDELDVGEVTLTALAAPGHTTEMTAFLVDDDGDDGDDGRGARDGGAGKAESEGYAPGVLLSGDSLFVDGVARPDLEDPAGAEAFARRLHETLQDRLLALPDATVVAPGHRGPGVERARDGSCTATLGTLRERLPALALDLDPFLERVTEGTPPRPANHERIVAVNLGLEAAEDDEAFELELGPNNCAAANG